MFNSLSHQTVNKTFARFSCYFTFYRHYLTAFLDVIVRALEWIFSYRFRFKSSAVLHVVVIDGRELKRTALGRFGIGWFHENRQIVFRSWNETGECGGAGTHARVRAENGISKAYFLPVRKKSVLTAGLIRVSHCQILRSNILVLMSTVLRYL